MNKLHRAVLGGAAVVAVAMSGIAASTAAGRAPSRHPAVHTSTTPAQPQAAPPVAPDQLAVDPGPAVATAPAQPPAAAAPPVTSDQFIMGTGAGRDETPRKSDGKTATEILLTELGATSVRADGDWVSVDTWGPAATDKFKVLPRVGGKLDLILDYSNPKYVTGGAFPNTPDERRAFLQYANKAISQIGYQNLSSIEVWNEWSGFMGWDASAGLHWNSPCPASIDPNDKPGCPVTYARLVQALVDPASNGITDVPSLRQTAPGVPVIVESSDVDWTPAMFTYLRQNNVQVDGATIHPYVTYPNGCGGPGGPQVAVKCVVTYSSLVDSAYGRHLPMWVTEVGWSRALGGSGYLQVNPQTQAQYAVETFVRMRATGLVQGVWWYEGEDSCADGSYECAFGLMARDPSDTRRPGALYPSGTAFAALSHFWAGCSSQSGSATDDTFQLPCADGTRQIFLAATAAQLTQASATGATLVDLLGQQADVAPGGNVSALVGHPVGVTGVGPAPAPAPAPTPTPSATPTPSPTPTTEPTTPAPAPTPTVTPTPPSADPPAAPSWWPNWRSWWSRWLR